MIVSGYVRGKYVTVTSVSLASMNVFNAGVHEQLAVASCQTCDVSSGAFKHRDVAAELVNGDARLCRFAAKDQTRWQLHNTGRSHAVIAYLSAY
jgi:hypothetical protein